MFFGGEAYGDKGVQLVVGSGVPGLGGDVDGGSVGRMGGGYGRDGYGDG